MRAGLTDKQAQILDFVRVEIGTRQRPPSLREIGARFEMAAPSVADHLDAIEKKGFLYREPGKRRNIRLSADAPVLAQASMLPLLGGVAAGTPLLAPGNIAEWCPLSPTLFHPPASFLMRVQGDSMVDVGISDGDVVAIRRQDVALNGQIVMAVLTDRHTGEHEVTLKRLRVEAGRFLLQSENRAANYPPIVVPRDTHEDDQTGLMISGIYCGHIHFGTAGYV